MRLSCDCSFSDSAPQTLWGPIYLSWLHVFVDPPREQTEIRRFFHRLYRFLFRAAHFACARTLFNGGFGETLLRAEEEHGHFQKMADAIGRRAVDDVGEEAVSVRGHRDEIHVLLFGDAHEL